MKKREVLLELQELKLQISNARYFCEKVFVNNKHIGWLLSMLEILTKLEKRVHRLENIHKLEN